MNIINGNIFLELEFAYGNQDFPGGSDGKASVYNAGRKPGFDPWVGKIPWRRKRQPTPVLLPRKSRGRRSLVQATAHEVAKSRTGLSDFTFTFTLWESKQYRKFRQFTFIRILNRK